MNEYLPSTMNLSTVLEAMPDSLVIIDKAGRIVHINAQTENLFGYAREELLGSTVEKLMPIRYHTNHVSHRNNYFAAPRARPMGANLELYGLKKNGSEFPIEISLSPLNTGTEILTLAAVRDVTERKHFEQTLQEKNIELEKANLAKNNFLASMSHELRTPLNAIIGFTGTLLMKLPGPLTTDQTKQLNTISNSAKHLLSLINDLLDLAKIESGKVEMNIETINCQNILEEIATTLCPEAQRKNLDFTLEMPEKTICIQSDKRALSQIIINLVNNAIKFTENGSIRLVLSIENGLNNNLIKFSIIDTGIGIKDENLGKLFNAFEKVHTNKHAEGTGLGLYLSQKLAFLLGAYIVCDSEFNKGSIFTLSISN